MDVLQGGVVSTSPNPLSWRTTPCRLSTTAFSISILNNKLILHKCTSKQERALINSSSDSYVRYFNRDSNVIAAAAPVKVVVVVVVVVALGAAAAAAAAAAEI
jgi:hypothetical protein